MIKFNTLLREAGADPAETKLVRHQDNRHSIRSLPYNLWRAGDGRFDLYQRIQSRSVFNGARMLASFVATPLNETLFVGIYAINGVITAGPGVIDPSTGDDVEGLNLYDLSLDPALNDYRGRLIVDWGDGYRAWVQRAHKMDKPIIEIRRSVSDPPFPGFLDFSMRLSQLPTAPLSWREALSAVSGVYLLTNSDTGALYVGSADGRSGFWGRWEDYVASGHGGNRRMRDVPVADYQVSILEVASSSASIGELMQMESRWKRKLLSRQHGLNAN